MSVEPVCVFSFDEADHLTRIHLKLALEDAGFVVYEDAETIALCDTTRPTASDRSTVKTRCGSPATSA
jgi:hypothetical protein